MGEKMEMNKWEAHNPIYQDIKNGELRHYPNMLYWNYGFLPQTYESPYRNQSICEIDAIVGDNDPVDVLEISNTTFAIGDLLEVKILGGMPNIDDFEEIDWKLIAVAKGTPEFDDWNDITDVPAYILSGVMEWYRWKKYYKNELQDFACNDTFLDAQYMQDVVLPQTHGFWKELVEGDLPIEDPPIFYEKQDKAQEPMDDGCRVNAKKEKKYGYKDCGKLNKEKKCAHEALCEWKENNNVCAHVCAVESKKECKKPTFRGKKICQFQK